MKDLSAYQRPAFHFSTPKGWCNDPNGFSFYKGKIHLFYQHYPFDTKWGPMHWGHAVSKDLLHWKNLPVALSPDTNYDDGGCFSGSAITVESGKICKNQKKHLLIYTGVKKVGESASLQQQCLALGNGKKYKKILENPVITAKNLPFDFDIGNFRDPKIWKKNGIYYAICMLIKNDGLSCLVAFKSQDLKFWEFLNIVDSSKDDFGAMWECPDFFTLDGKDVILISERNLKADAELGFYDGDNNVYITGNLDSNFEFHREIRPENGSTAALIDYGIDFYAQQTTLLPDGRRILIAWMQAWESYITPENYKWSGMMTLPREISFVENRLIQKPVREFEELKGKAIFGSISDREFKLIDNESNRHFELIFDLPANLSTESKIAEPPIVATGEIIITISASANEYVTLSIKIPEMTIRFNRKHTNHAGKIPARTAKIPQLLPVYGDKIKYHIIADTNSLEAYVNQGEFWFTNAYFLDSPISKITVESTLGEKVNFSFYKL